MIKKKEKKKIKIGSLDIHKPTLDDVFMIMTEKRVKAAGGKK